ncbi:hypothetical protein [Polyangium spumosum]|uniref:Secreted protein n=1 Tax=Polyangium spumosum TaxID=889282 RepID=A0A6N7PPV1_9BACT|nr:hypothetical protein [Polyangium spumosum]MRG92114.1 hypothetical protein [Polyangium spumosum]
MKKQFAHWVPFGIGAALLTAAAFTCDTASAQAIAECSARSGTVRAVVRQSTRIPGICIRMILSGPPAPGALDCWATVRNDPSFTCTEVVD